MSPRKKNSNDLPLFLKYARGGMKEKERNAFERKLQKDPFEAEAAEGFSLISPEEAGEDFSILTERLKRHTTKKRPLPLMRIAAVITLLLGTAAVLVIFRIDDRQPLVSENIQLETGTKTPLTIASPVPIYESDKQKNQSSTGSALITEKVTGYEPAVFASKHEDLELAVDVSAEEKDARLVEAQEEIITDAMAAIMPEETKKVALPHRKIEGTVISAEDKLPLPGVSVALQGKVSGVAVTDLNGRFSFDVASDSSMKLVARYVGMVTQEIPASHDKELLITMNSDNMALEEVVVTGYGVRSKRDATGAVATIETDREMNENDYTPAAPVTGNSEFRRYIESELQYPSGVIERSRQVVLVSMIVRTDGTIDSLKVLKSPGKAFSDEAMRLINKGPAWKPAINNGKTTEEEVRIRIVFK